MNKPTVTQTAKAATFAYMTGALAVSFTHIQQLFATWGARDWQGQMMPAFIDGVALYGKLLRSESNSTKTRRVGLAFQLTAALVSLVANVLAGHTLAHRIIGVVVVTIYLAMELASGHIESAAVEAQRNAEAELAAKAAAEAQAAADKRAAAIAKGKATRQANRAAAAQLVKAAERTTRQAAKQQLGH